MSDQIGTIDVADSRTNGAWQRQVSRRGFLKAGAVVGAVAAGLGQVPGAARAAGHVARQAGSQVTLRFMSTGGIGYQAYYKKAVAEFEKLHPEIAVQLEPTSGDFATKLKVEMAGGTAPDMVSGADDSNFSFAARGTLHDLSGFWHSSGRTASDYWPNAWNPMWLGKQLISMPLDYGMWVFQYNKALFDRAHLRYPDLSWTWDDFVRILRKLTLDHKGRTAEDPQFDPQHVVQYGNDGGLNWSWNVLLRSQGLEWATPDLSKSRLDDPRVIAQFQWIADLGNKYYVNPSPKFPSGVNWAIDAGNLATFFGGTWDIADYAQHPHFYTKQWDFTGYPKGKAGRAVIAECSGMIMPAQTSHPAETWKLMEFVTSAQGLAMAHTYNVNMLNPYKSLSRQFLSKATTPPHAKLILDLLPQAGIPFWCEAISDSELEGILITSPWPDMLRLYSGQESAKTVMPRVASKVNAILTADQGKAKQFGATLHL